MTSPSTGEGHTFTSDLHLIYAAVGGDDSICVCKSAILLACF